MHVHVMCCIGQWANQTDLSRELILFIISIVVTIPAVSLIKNEPRRPTPLAIRHTVNSILLFCGEKKNRLFQLNNSVTRHTNFKNTTYTPVRVYTHDVYKTLAKQSYGKKTTVFDVDYEHMHRIHGVHVISIRCKV